MFVFSRPPFFSLLRQVNLGSRIKDWFFLRIVRDFYLGNILRVALKMLRTTKAASRGVWPEFLASFTKKIDNVDYHHDHDQQFIFGANQILAHIHTV